ncbi:hypothetical protein QR98_0050790 [Sarcoptes scabiei]|uniref:Uncharacterized protein n=1 Tax=Sarcoptes scabiei TaxID=52283 RepID=A0A132A6M1_SARSC|nr:hypothetical protein QR98_0050790 [Sarcoptes scabiei]
MGTVSPKKEVSDKYQRKMKEYYDKNTKLRKFKVGEKVLLKHPTLAKGKSPKLTPSFKGPFKIKEILANNKILIQDKNGQTLDTHRDLVKHDKSNQRLKGLRKRGRPRMTKKGRVRRLPNVTRLMSKWIR